jgi:hypothetical protein
VFQGLLVSGFYSCSQAPILFQFIGNFEQNQYGFPAFMHFSTAFRIAKNPLVKRVLYTF